MLSPVEYMNHWSISESETKKLNDPMNVCCVPEKKSVIKTYELTQRGAQTLALAWL